MDHIKSVDDLGEHFIRETSYYWEHYKDLKKPGTGKSLGFENIDSAKMIIAECIERYNKEFTGKFQ
jgi:inorganic pyrophosphatase